MNNPFDYTPDPACDAAYAELLLRLEELKASPRQEDAEFIRELEAGKMLGVLIAADSRGERHTLYAFSGQLGGGEFHRPGFVEPVFDYLLPDGHFKRREKEIVCMNREIEAFERGPLEDAACAYREAKAAADAEEWAFRGKCLLRKEERRRRRTAGSVDEEEAAAMTRQSQFDKAELRRLRQRLTSRLEPVKRDYEAALHNHADMKAARRAASENLQQWLFSNFRLRNACGETRSLSEIFAETPTGIPPSGAGECCAPKLLQAAYLNGWTPLAMAEYWYGKPRRGEVREHGRHYPACSGKCGPVLEWMLQGLEVESPPERPRPGAAHAEPEVIFENRWFCVAIKPAGMLSVPGKGEDRSLQRWLSERYGAEKDVRMAHRLDQDTSGLIVATFGELAFKTMQSLFARRLVSKTYVADLEGDYVALGIPGKGRIELPLTSDWLDRPRQRVDGAEGKEAVTDYEFISMEDGRSRVLFTPLTGRTHQLRVHAASRRGLGMPIVGDRLYGRAPSSPSGRMHLHAAAIEFTFPIDSRHYRFEAPYPSFN